MCTWPEIGLAIVMSLICSLFLLVCVLLHFYSNSWSHIGDFTVRRGMEEDNSSAMMKTFSLCKILQMHDVVNCTTNIKEMDWINFAKPFTLSLETKGETPMKFISDTLQHSLLHLCLPKKKQNALQNVIFNNEFNF